MKYFIVGSGKVGSRLAVELSEAGHEVTILSNSVEALRRIPEGANVRQLVHHGIDIDYLVGIGARGADALIALTDDDNLNILATKVAVEFLSIQRAVARISDPELAAFYESRGIRTICPTTIVLDLAREAITK